MSENIQKPAVRFKGFTNTWDQRTFGRCVVIQRGGSPRPIENYITNDLNGINWIKIGDVSIGSRYITSTKEKIKPEGEKNSRRVYIGDLILSNSMSFGRPYIMKVSGCIHDGWLLIRDEKKLFNTEYLLQLLSSPYMFKQYKSLASGGVVNNLNSELVQSTLALIPTLAEQEKIGAFFKELDALITLHQRKYNKLVNIKKSMLDKLFPKNDSNVPEVRFSGFTNAWEQRTLGEDIADIIGGGTPDTLNSSYWDGDIDWYSPTEIGKNAYADSSVKKITKLGLEKSSARILPPDKTILFTSRAGIGDMAILRREATTNQGFQSLVIKNDFNVYFIYSMGFLIKKYAEKNASGSTFLEISAKTLGKLNICIPTLAEQEKLGAFFKALDALITLHQRKLEKLKNIKRSCLDKMFV